MSLNMQLYVEHDMVVAAEFKAETENELPSEKNTPETLQAFQVAVDVLAAIKNRDYQLLAEYAHPKKGIIFSPDPFVDDSMDVVFHAAQIRAFASDSITYNWGYFDQSETLLELTANEYFNRFVYDKNFYDCHQIGINSIIRSGNCPENVMEEFPNAIFVEFHDEGTEEDSYLDWASLKIVLERYNGDFKVVALISSSYTL